MYSHHRALVSFIAAIALLSVGVSGCVSNQAYDLVKRDAENARQLYQNEQRHGQELAASNKRMKQQLEELDATLKDMRDKLARTEREWRESRDELLRIKIEREQRRGTAGRGSFQLGLEDTKPLPDGPEVSARKAPAGSEDTKRRLHDLLEQLQVILQQF